MTRITPDNLDKWLFNLNEGNLSSSEKRELDSFLTQHPEYNVDADAWKLSEVNEKLVPIAFESELHAIAGGSTIYVYRKWAVAATLLLLLGGSAFYIFFGSDDSSKTFADFTSKIKNQNFSNDYTNTYSSNKNSISKEENELGNSNTSSTTNEIDFTALNNTSSSFGNVFNQEAIKYSNNQSATNGNGNNSTNTTHTKDNQLNNNRSNKTRQQVSIDIKNEFKIKTEKSVELVQVLYEDNLNTALNNEIVTPDEKFSIESEKKAKLSLKENQNIQVIAENKNNIENTKRKKSNRHKLDPNPTFTNLRDQNLLMTNNHLIDQYAAFSGGMISSRYTTNYRNTWTSHSEVNSQSMIASYDKLLRKLKTGIGFAANYNNYGGGMFTTIGAALTISPKFKVGRSASIEPAVTFSYAQKSSNTNATAVGSFIEDRRGNVLQLYRNGIRPEATSAFMPDMKIGAVFQNKKFWVATSVDHLLLPKETLYTTESHLYKNEIEFKATVGTDYLHRPESGNVVSPQMTIYYHDGYTEMWLGAQARFKQFSIGASFSQFQDYLATVGFQTPSFKVFYQYDKTRSLLLNEKMGSHEIGLRFALNGNNRNSKSILNNER
jgi:type IX secretion system PorP/SprF family membrane protein